jgi:putative membrane protein
MSPEHFWWGPMWMFPMIMPIVMLVALILCLYFMFGRGGGRMPWQPPGTHQAAGGETESPLDILKRRYAKGEITKDEYEQIKQDLQR